MARKICDRCHLQAQCLEYALENRINHGVWGGTSERQRRRILKARRLAATEAAESQAATGPAVPAEVEAVIS